MQPRQKVHPLKRSLRIPSSQWRGHSHHIQRDRCWSTRSRTTKRSNNVLLLLLTLLIKFMRAWRARLCKHIKALASLMRMMFIGTQTLVTHLYSLHRFARPCCDFFASLYPPSLASCLSAKRSHSGGRTGTPYDLAWCYISTISTFPAFRPDCWRALFIGFVP
jgi:hypothetical protein